MLYGRLDVDEYCVSLPNMVRDVRGPPLILVWPSLPLCP